jgi:hypothetical protein
MSVFPLCATLCGKVENTQVPDLPVITAQKFQLVFYLTCSAGGNKIQLPKVFGGVAIPSKLILPSNIALVEQG